MLKFTACALFDSSVSQSFFSIASAQICSLQIKALPHNVVVMILDESIVACTQVVKECPVEVEGKILNADLMVFCLMGFDLILGMDWLFNHYAKIDCQKREGCLTI